ncbi:Trm112 family protein [Hydrogenobaculum acidophilum]
MIDKELLDILACPKCKGELIYNKDKNILICGACKLVYTIEDDIPIMLIEQAKPLDEYIKKS